MNNTDQKLIVVDSAYMPTETGLPVWVYVLVAAVALGVFLAAFLFTLWVLRKK